MLQLYWEAYNGQMVECDINSDLYEALKEAREYLKAFVNNFNIEALKQVEKALAKAEGK